MTEGPRLAVAAGSGDGVAGIIASEVADAGVGRALAGMG
jgi:hypothetical protein